MNNILSGISGYFSKSLILGTFLPVVMFVILSWLFAVPLLPPTDWPMLKLLEALDTEWKVLAISFLTIVLTGLSYNINIPLIRIYEGYAWKDLWVGRQRTKKYQRLFRVAQAQWKGIPHIVSKLRQADPKNPHVKPLNRIKDLAGRNLNTDFPGGEDLILPTRLGNVIRSFEHYPHLRYNIEAVTVWPRLIAKIDKDYAAGIDDAKTSFDFMLNCSALSLLFGFIILIVGLLYPAHLNSPGLTIIWLCEIVTFWGLARLFYFLSISRAKSWGNMVRGAFDLYRWELLKQLGYTRMPESLKEERALWFNISHQMVFGEHPLVAPAKYISKIPSVSIEPENTEMEIWRGVNPPQTPAGQTPATSAAQLMTVEIRVRNAGKQNAKKVFVTDALPDDFAYKWNSVQIVRNEKKDNEKKDTKAEDAAAKDVVAVTGTNPYRFSVGSLKSGGELILTYQAIPLKSEVMPESKDARGINESSLLVFQGDLFTYHQTGNTPLSTEQKSSTTGARISPAEIPGDGEVKP